MNNIEISFLNRIREMISPFFDKLFEIITFLGGQEVLIIIVVIVYFIVSKKIGQRIAFSVFGSLLLNNTLKSIINRIRPFRHPNANYTLSDNVTTHASGQSFPSGHSQNVSVTYTSIAIAFNRRPIWILSIVAICLVGISRIVLGVHYPTDVVVGITLGISCAFLGAYLHQKAEEDIKRQMILYLIVAIIFSPFIIFFLTKDNLDYPRYKDLFTSYSFFIGYIIAVWLDSKFVNFDCHNPLKKRIFRAIIALVIIVGIQFGLKVILPKDNVLLDMLRYFLLSFIGLGLYPLITKKYLFSTKNEL